MSQNRNPGQKTVFRRINGRIVPIGVRNEAGAVVRTKRDVARNPAGPSTVAKIAGLAALSFAGSFGAGRLKKVSEVMKAGRMATATEKAAKVTDFGAKAGVGLLIGSEITKIDRMSRHDERSQFFNAGSQGVSAAQIAGTLGVGFVGYRVTKRFQKWGYRGGKFPWKLKDL